MGSFDFLLAAESPSPPAIRRAATLLKPGGQAVFIASNQRGLARRKTEYARELQDAGFVRWLVEYQGLGSSGIGKLCASVFPNLTILARQAPLIRALAPEILLQAWKSRSGSTVPAPRLCDHPGLRGAVSVVIPCRNEALNVRRVVDGLREMYGDYLHEIILVDDNSRDATRQVMEAIARDDGRIKPIFRSPPNGVGRAIRDGMQMATGEFILSMDCDFQHLLPELRDLFDAAAEGYDAVYGSRFSTQTVLRGYPFPKLVANRLFHGVAGCLLGHRVRDCTNNLKLLRREVVARLQLTQPGFGVNAQTGLQPLRMGFRVKEVPISWINRSSDMGVSSFRLLRVGRDYCQALLGAWRSKKEAHQHQGIEE